MIKKFGVQVYSLRDKMTSEPEIRESFKKLADFGYSQIQTAGYCGLTPEQYASCAFDAGLEIIGTHSSMAEIFDQTEETMRIHKEILHTTNIGTGGIWGPARDSKKNLFEYIDKLNNVADKISKHGLKFTYHNHHMEFVRLPGENKTIMDYLYEELDPKNISFCFDTYWVQAGGASPEAWLRKLAGRVDIIHLKDMVILDDGTKLYTDITEIGHGNLDFKGIIKIAEEIGVKYYIVEQDTCPGNPLDSLKFSADYIKENLM